MTITIENGPVTKTLYFNDNLGSIIQLIITELQDMVIEELEEEAALILEPDNLFDTEDEAYEILKDGTQEETEAAIDRVVKVGWYRCAARLKNQLNQI